MILTYHMLKTRLKDSAKHTSMEEHSNIFATNLIKEIKTIHQLKRKLLQDLCI